MTGDGDGAGTDTLEVDGDGLAGIVDLFGSLTRAELERALEELAYKRGTDVPDPSLIDRAVERYALVTHEAGTARGEGCEHDAADLLVPGPSAFPSLPPGAEDLPHIMEVPERTVDREAVGRAVEERFRADVARALASDDGALVGRLIDVSYDLDAWGLDLADLRARLDDAREDR